MYYTHSLVAKLTCRLLKTSFFGGVLYMIFVHAHVAKATFSLLSCSIFLGIFSTANNSMKPFFFLFLFTGHPSFLF